MEYEVGETLGISASVGEDDTCYESDNAFIEMHDFVATLVGRSYEDVVVTVQASLDMVDNSPTSLIHSMLSLHAYYPALPLRVTTCHFFTFIMCLRGIR